MAKKRTPQKSVPPTASAYLQDPVRTASILGSFAVLVVPLAVLQLGAFSPSMRFALSVSYAVLLGGTHFLITLAIYFHKDNLRYFTSSPANIAIYFVAPVAILALFFVIGTFQLNADHPNPSAGFLLYIFLFSVVVKGFDYFHVVRQSFGVLQMFKAQTPATFPEWMRKADNNFFLAMSALQLLTYVNGVRTGNFVFAFGPVTALALAWAAISLGGVIVGFSRALGSTDKPGALLVPVGYFVLQGASATLPALRTELYTASLAMHYVEYHIIIFPRLFNFALDPASPADRTAAWTRRHKVAFYVVLAALACFVSRDLWPAVSEQLGSPRAPWLLFNLLSGIFVTHYFIEAFVWKFRNPYYRQSLSPLYFPQRNRSTTAR